MTNQLKNKIRAMRAADIRLLCGEMTPDEMRTAKALLGWFVRQLEEVESHEEPKNTAIPRSNLQ